MPDLPTLTVTTAQATRIQNAFPGATQAERVESYKTWLRRAVKDYVVMHERQVLQTKFETDVAASAATVETDLTGI